MSEDEVRKAIEVIKQYMEEHDLSSPAFTGHAVVFFKEIDTYMNLKEVERKIDA